MIRAFIRDDRAVSATEFAIVLPFLVLLFVGGYQLSDGISAYRKVTMATRTVADLTSQYSTVSNDELDMILAASQQVLAPYKIDDAQLIVSQIKIDGSGNAKVDWSRPLNTTGLTPGSSYPIPAAIKQNNTSLIVATIRYNYLPTTASTMIGPIPMRDDIIMSPRASSTITKKV